MLVLALVALPLRCLGFSAAAPRSFPGASFGTNPELGALKLQIAQLSASLDRGQLRYKYGGNDGAYKDKSDKLGELLDALVEKTGPIPRELAALDGEWELLYTDVKHGIFRSSPFFQSIENAYQDKEKSELFFRLHELQTCSFGISTVGKVAQVWNSENRTMASEFATSILGLATIPIVGFGQLPFTPFGGCVVTMSRILSNEIGEKGEIDLEVDFTRAKEVPGLPPLPILGDRVYDITVPVRAIWELLPWNKDTPKSTVRLVYYDEDTVVFEHLYGARFIYTRPVV